MLWHGAVLICNSDSDVRRWSRLCRISCPSGERCRLWTETLLLNIHCQPTCLGIPWTNWLFREGCCGCHERWVTCQESIVSCTIFDQGLQVYMRWVCLTHQSDPNQFFRLNRSHPDDLLNIQWASGTVTKYCWHTFFFHHHFYPTTLQRAAGTAVVFFHLCTSRPLTSGSVLVGATGSKPRALLSAVEI